MELPNWRDIEFYMLLSAIGLGLVVVAMILNMITSKSTKISGTFAGILGGAAAGLALGVLLMFWEGYDLRAKTPPGGMPGGAGGMDGPPGGMMPAGGGPGGMGKGGGGMAKGGGAPKGGGKPMGPGAGGPGGGRARNPKTTLAGLVNRVDVLTGEPSLLKLSDDQKQKLADALKNLGPDEEMSDADAQKAVDAIYDALKDERQTLEGLLRPTGAVEGTHPFTIQDNYNHLKSLRDKLAGKKPEKPA